MARIAITRIGEDPSKYQVELDYLTIAGEREEEFVFLDKTRLMNGLMSIGKARLASEIGSARTAQSSAVIGELSGEELRTFWLEAANREAV